MCSAILLMDFVKKRFRRNYIADNFVFVKACYEQSDIFLPSERTIKKCHLKQSFLFWKRLAYAINQSKASKWEEHFSSEWWKWAPLYYT